jgi:hypothetical protein
MSEEKRPSDPQSIVDETREFWREMARNTVKNSSTAIEETAKHLIGITGILEGLYFHAITFADLQGSVSGLLTMLAYLAPLIFWLFSLVSAGLVFFPRVFETNINSSEAGKTMHEEVVPRKYLFLILSLIWLVVGILFLIIALGVYLSQGVRPEK